VAAKKPTKRTRTKPRYVLATDAHRGIVWGELVEQDRATKTCVLKNARHCFYYKCIPDHEGILGLATAGPGPGSKIGPTVERHEFFYEKLTDCTAEAVGRWRDAKWGG
jgi:hypothetical protein